jgi:hypothetical protein
MLRPGLHLSNAIGVTDADLDICSRWSPLSLLEAMNNIIDGDLPRFLDAWRRGGEPEIVLRMWYEPKPGTQKRYELHARQSCDLARKCIAAGIPAEKIMVKPFNEPNMPDWANWEGFGDKPEQIEQYGQALMTFIHVVKNELPAVRVGGPHTTVGNRDVKFPNDPPGEYYYHGPDMRFAHFVHCYALNPGEYKNRAHGLRFLEYEKYLHGKPVYNVEAGCAINAPWLPQENVTRAEDTVNYLRLLGDKYPQVKGIAFFIGGDRQWDAFRHSGSWSPDSHYPVVYKVQEGAGTDPDPDPDPDPNPGKYTLLKGLLRSGISEVVDLRPEIESFSDMPRLWATRRTKEQIWYIMLHHTGDEIYRDPIRIARYHTHEKPGDKDPTIPYPFCIDGKRLYVTGRPFFTLLHCGAGFMATHSLGIAVIGDLTKRKPTADELDTLRRLVLTIQEWLGGGWGKYRGFMVVPHNWHWPSTECPGSLTQAFCWQGDWPMVPFCGTVAASDVADATGRGLDTESEDPQ